MLQKFCFERAPSRSRYLAHNVSAYARVEERSLVTSCKPLEVVDII